MRLFSLTIPKPLDAAVGACRRPLAPAAVSALAHGPYPTATIDTTQVAGPP